jgi:ubiquitin-protein ligase E3 D
MSRPKTLIYAELLSNIRQISIIAALEVPCDSSTQVELSQDGHQFLLHHDGNVHTLNLPGCALMDFRLQSPALGSKELSWRLPLAGEPRIPSAESSDAPWPAKDLKESSEFRCRSCGEVVVGKGAVRVWKDLPSENWAEMMDFWHCHKPSVHEPNCSTDSGHRSHDKAHGSDRGYGANTKFTAQPRTGFVDMTTLLLAKPDCRGIEVRTLSLRPYPILSRRRTFT